MSHTCLVYHVVFTTHQRAPLISPQVEDRLYRAIRRVMADLGGRPLAINGTEDHVHLVFGLKPSITLSFFVGQVKARTSPYLLGEAPRELCRWQTEYSAFTVNPNRMTGLLAYVANQKENHSTHRLEPALEWVPSREQPTPPFELI